MAFIPIVTCATYFLVDNIADNKTFPDFNLEKLKHPLYQNAYLDTKSDEFFA